MTFLRNTMAMVLLGALSPLAAHAESFELRFFSKGLLAAQGFSTLGSPAVSQAFGEALTGGSASSPIAFAFRNIGGRAGTLAVPAFSGDNPGDFSANSSCTKVPKSGDCEVAVSFRPTEVGLRSSTLTLNGVTYAFSGTGLGVAKFVTDSPGTLTAGSTYVSTPTSVSMVFTNNGTASGSFSIPPAFGGANPGDFSVSASPACSNVSITQSCTVTLTFRPTAEGLRSATVVLNGTTYTISGTGQNLPAVMSAVDTREGMGLSLSADSLTGSATATSSNTWRASTTHSSGKYYFECTFDTLAADSGGSWCGVVPVSDWKGAQYGLYDPGYAVIISLSCGNSAITHKNVHQLLFSGYPQYCMKNGGVTGVALDIDAGKISYISNGYVLGPYNVTAGVAYYAGVGVGAKAVTSGNFGQKAFQYQDKIPAGYKAGW